MVNNRTSGRASLVLTALDEDGQVVTKREWPWIILPCANHEVEPPRMFPWATLSSNEEADQGEYEAECGIWDK